MATALPLVDLGPLRRGPGDGAAPPGGEVARIAAEIDGACRRFGFFCVAGHGIAAERRADLDRLARAFFTQPDEVKARIAMARAGPAWRGWFPLGGELTSGRPDLKEGLYFGAELGAENPAVRAGRPLHGPNLFPDEPAALPPAVLWWMAALTDLGALLLRPRPLGLCAAALRSWFSPGPARAASVSNRGNRPGTRGAEKCSGVTSKRNSRHSIGPLKSVCVRFALIPSALPSGGLPVSSAARQPR